jgi:hypothetical protein
LNCGIFTKVLSSFQVFGIFPIIFLNWFLVWFC